MWKIKQKDCPKTDPNYAIAKKNDKGQLITGKEELKNLYKNVYISKLKHREIRLKYSG